MLPGVIPCSAAPVVVPCFILLDFILSGAILEPVSLFARGAGCTGSVCADAIAVAPNNEATTRADIASLDRMRILPISIVMLELELVTRICVPPPALKAIKETAPAFRQKY
jgi:hypothetical protein